MFLVYSWDCVGQTLSVLSGKHLFKGTCYRAHQAVGDFFHSTSTPKKKF